MAADKAEDSLRGNVQGTLDDLSTSTGGFLVANTNDLGAKMQNVAKSLAGREQALPAASSARRVYYRRRPPRNKSRQPGSRI